MVGLVKTSECHCSPVGSFAKLKTRADPGMRRDLAISVKWFVDHVSKDAKDDSGLLGIWFLRRIWEWQPLCEHSD
jgi:hypothetical protein